MIASFSVLLSVYHKEEPAHLNDALQSIWENQTLKPNEIVLVKDGPLTIELDQVIEQWEDKLGNIFKVIALPKNVGLGKALNEGIKTAQYDIIVRMDSDDISTPDRFEKQIAFLKDHPDVDIVGGQMAEFVGTPEHIVSERIVPLSYEDIMSYAHTRSPFNHATTALRKNMLVDIGMYQHHLYMEDYNLWIRALAKGYKGANLPDMLLYMRSDGMHGRRRGWKYIKSEWQMYKLKKDLKFQNRLLAFMLFLLKSSMRLLPATILQKVYSVFLRKNKLLNS